MGERIIIDRNAQKGMQAYIEYDAIVGNDDGGKLLSDKEYDQFKRNLAAKQKDRLYISWRNIKGNECKYVGPATKCFCGHRLKEHDVLNSKGNKQVHCKNAKCKCINFFYIPTHGSYDFKCLCKHSYLDHDPVTRKCKRGGCAGCHAGFNSTWSCSCGYKFGDHRTVIETRQERIDAGYAIDDTLALGAQMQNVGGNLTKFSNMVDYADGFQKQIEDMGGVSGINNKQAPLGYKPMQAIQSQQYEEQNMDKSTMKKKSLLAGLNKKIQQEKQIDSYDHYQQDSSSQQSTQLSVQGYQQQQQQFGYQNQTQQLDTFGGVQGEISALKLYNTPHQFSRVQINPRFKNILNTKY